MNYPTGDFLIQLKNAYMARKKEMEVPYSKVILGIAKILEKEGYVGKTKQSENEGKKKVVIALRYDKKIPAINEIKLISRPSIHHYVGKTRIKRAIPSHAMGIISTNLGIMTSKEAEKRGVGGELICQIF
jgi:small subunit ribosomal protein S8